ncbi:MATE family efflux transporter [Metabacillus litoralis]|uniref:MATE family efflux transporter n=1 Tax=Metabacillus litoralis TaxID=152268 RepID=UPI000EF58070|nr:MATE family efflux transporter [Metabacillus litoralis]
MKSVLTSAPLHKGSIFTHREYLTLAIPLIISGISTPILGAVDTAVVGRLPDASAIGAVALGAVIFNTMYWLLGFLRVSTTGLTSQANGANDAKEMALACLRPMFLAVLIGSLFIILQIPILKLSLYLFGTSESVGDLVSTYFSIRIWGAPFALLNYVLIGWLMGLGKVKLSLSTQITMNVLNIVLDLLFVLVFGLGVAGVAYATVIAEISAIFIGLFFMIRTKLIDLSMIQWRILIEKAPLVKMLKVNRDFFLRSICLLTMTVTFTTIGARLGETALAANAILLQIHYLMAYLLGGFANASSIVVGRSIGSKQFPLFKRALSLSLFWGTLSACLLSLIMLLFDESIFKIFTSIEEVNNAVIELGIWMVIYPIAGFWALQLEGIFAGATDAKSVRNSIFYALLAFVIVILIYGRDITPHELWLSFTVFTLGRTVFLSMYVRKIERSNFR